jgi:quinol monooxygenase YgiN
MPARQPTILAARGGHVMTAYNAVRFRVKPGREQDFIDAHHRATPSGWPGFRRGALIRTGDRTFCFLGEWESMEAMAAARPHMIAVLDSFRDTLEDLGGGLGMTDPVSGTAVVEYPARGG